MELNAVWSKRLTMRQGSFGDDKMRSRKHESNSGYLKFWTKMGESGCRWREESERSSVLWRKMEALEWMKKREDGFLGWIVAKKKWNGDGGGVYRRGMWGRRRESCSLITIIGVIAQMAPNFPIIAKWAQKPNFLSWIRIPSLWAALSLPSLAHPQNPTKNPI